MGRGVGLGGLGGFLAGFRVAFDLTAVVVWSVG